MKKLLILFFALTIMRAEAQDSWFLSVINDPDGYTFIRSGKGKNFPVIDTIRENSFFYCIGDTATQWINVQRPMGKNGYMHKSRIAFFSNLDSARQVQLILDGFAAMIAGEKAYLSIVRNASQKKIAEANRQRDAIHESSYIPAYTAMHELFCKKPDSLLLVSFMKTLPWVTGSADEGISWTAAECWLCQPNFVEQFLDACPNDTERKIMAGFIITGIEMGAASGMSEAQQTNAIKKLERL